ncbi:uncharacterized protein [Aegilops tauschii subsp. strangulata]|uniref:uncharacterized protein n=1 Tax=Aegilops tauschii subsp. strangulata TaxID=200361 RepID=UPI003CC84CA1
MWKRPNRGSVKINVDASYNAETLSGPTGAIARDDKGQFLSAATWYIPHVSSAVSAELIAIRNGLYLAANIGCNRVIIESDSALAIEAVNNHDNYFGQDAATVVECKMLASDYASASFDNCFREANSMADSLAKFSFTSTSSVWDSTPPDLISHLIGCSGVMLLGNSPSTGRRKAPPSTEKVQVLHEGACMETRVACGDAKYVACEMFYGIAFP